jgi:hypothetical protein
MITKFDMMKPLLEVCPSFMPKWQEFLHKWRDEVDLPLYVALSDLARHLIELVEREETKELPEVVRVVERWHLEGDDYVREAATIGLLEDLQNLNLHQGKTTPDQFRAMLKPESIREWDELAEWWERFFLDQELREEAYRKQQLDNNQNK